jgi:hypothetical protein
VHSEIPLDLGFYGMHDDDTPDRTTIWPTGEGRTAQAARPCLIGVREYDDSGDDAQLGCAAQAVHRRCRGIEGRKTGEDAGPGRTGVEGRKAGDEGESGGAGLEGRKA